MATNQARTALCVLFCIFLGLSLQQVNLKVTEPCKYLDPNSISCDDSNSCTGMIHFHEKQANDLFSRHQYKLDLTYTMTSNEIMYIKKDDLTVQLNSMMVGQKTYKDKAESTWLDYGFIRIPFMATPMALSKMYSQIPEKSYLFVPYIVDSSVTQTDIKILLREYFKTSALNTNSATTGTGTIITRVKNMPDTARGVVLVAPVMVRAEADISTAGYTQLMMATDNQNGFPSGTESEENKDNQIFYTNCKIIMDRSSERIKDFSEEQEYINFVLWLMTVSTLLYFVWSIGSEVSEPLLPHYEGGARWFNHPLYSTWVYGSPRQTKTSRVTLVLMNFAAQVIGCALIHEVLDEESEGARVGIGLAVGFGFGFIASQFFGCILVGLVNVHRLFLNEIKTCDTHDKREACFQVYENRRLSRNYLFYFLALAFYGGCMWGSIGLTINFDNTRFWYFMLSLAICVFGEFIILDFLRVALGKGDGCIARFIQSRGYYIDYKLDLDYESYLADNE